MNNNNINSEELRYLLENTPSDQVILLSGRHGIGKSSILDSFYTSKGLPVVTFFLGQMSDPGDLIGLPYKNEKTGKTDFMPPYWFPVDGKPIVLFLDELNRARPELLQTVMDLVLNQRLAGKALPKGTRIIAAVNDGQEYQVEELDPALVSRFNVYSFTPSVDDWVSWAEVSGVDTRVIEFIRNSPDYLEQESSEEGLTKTPDRRAWVKVSHYLSGRTELNRLDGKVIAGMVGEEAALLFMKANLRSLSTKEEGSVSAQEVLTDFEACRGRISAMRLHERAMLAKSVMEKVTSTKCNEQNVIKYVEFLADEADEEVLEMLVATYSLNEKAITKRYLDLADRLFEIKAEYDYAA